MNLNEFKENALKTEAIPDSINVNEKLLLNVMGASICIGEILDQIKKNAMYGKDYNQDDFNNLLHNALELLNDIRNVDLNDKHAIDVNVRIFHAIVGIATESSELLYALLNDINGEDIDYINVSEEFSDISWYQAIGFDEIGIDWGQSLESVINKLKVRYPNKFTSHDAINRNLDKERVELEKV